MRRVMPAATSPRLALTVTGELPAWLSGAVALASTAGTTWWLTRKERKTRGDDVMPADASTSVVAATFTERSLMQNLTAALVALNGTIHTSNEVSGELVELLRADAHRREVETEVREALRKRGILE